jgi:PAS domain S-box-containing protein
LLLNWTSTFMRDAPFSPSTTAAAPEAELGANDAGVEIGSWLVHDTLASLREGVQILAPDWRYLFVNDAVARHGRKSREELLGRTMLACYPGIENTAIFATLERCMRERRAETIENEFEYEDGQRAWFELRIQPCGQGLIVLSLDISERKRLEALLRQGEKLRALGQLAASVAHDLKNVLNPIALETEILRRQLGAGWPAADDRLARIEEAVRMGSEMVERLRSFSRQEPDGAAEPADLNRVADLALELCVPRLRERTGVEVRRVRGDAPPVSVRTSELVTGVVNLVVNALDAIAARGTIEVRTGGDGNDNGGSGSSGWIEVRDDGSGMPVEVERRAFEPFFTTKAQGTGLGLATIYALVQRHGGRVSLDTGAGRGTAIQMWFPAARPAETAPALPAIHRPRHGRRVLVVEDEPASRAALGTLLRDEGFTVDAASDGQEALAKLSAFDPEALLVDLRMPGMDGATFARRARARGALLPVVLMSGLDGSHPDVESVVREPRTEHLGKPFDVDRLLAALDRALSPAVAK